MADPFAAHPELRPLIRDARQSALRRLGDAADVDHASSQLSGPKRRSLEEREVSRRDTLAEHAGDLWVFAYGSLMWDPAMEFAEVRRAWLPGHSRRFILCDIHGARGTREAPGLMAALDRGNGCHGLAFRIPDGSVERESRNLWAREMTLPSYVPRLLPADLGDERVEALVFLADHGAEMIRNDLTRDQQVRFAATGTGFLGSSREYLETIARQFAALGIEDPDVNALLAEVRAFLS
jgi:cation transport protein ChaC